MPTGEREVEIPVSYDGPDLALVADLTGLSPADVVAAHTGTPWTVAFGGFAPGFAYLVGGDPRLTVPRKTTPRTRVPAGAVGLAGEFSGIYPTSSPGGWQLLGRTDVVLFDPDADPPALLTPGTRVRFRAVKERAVGPAPSPRVASEERASVSRGSRALTLTSSQLPVLVVDRGRTGYAAVGVGRSGAADRGAYELGARLVGNFRGEAALELTMGSATLTATGTLTLALTGAPVPADAGGRAVSMATVFHLGDGESLTVGAPRVGLRTYLSVRGGMDVPAVLGSRSRDTLAGLGPEPLQPGDQLPVGAAMSGWIPPTDWAPLPPADDVVDLAFTPGPRSDWISSLDQTQWTVGSAVDRIGARLEGTALQRLIDGELPSEPVVRGAVQVPPSGQPVIFLVDHPLTGGYPVAAVLAEESADRAAQLRPGSAVRFTRRPSR
jgi:biotin-dependent carboxylase-like uncharacterized protein